MIKTIETYPSLKKKYPQFKSVAPKKDWKDFKAGKGFTAQVCEHTKLEKWACDCVPDNEEKCACCGITLKCLDCLNLFVGKKEIRPTVCLINPNINGEEK